MEREPFNETEQDKRRKERTAALALAALRHAAAHGQFTAAAAVGLFYATFPELSAPEAGDTNGREH